jgi:hypothetical protein
VVRGGVLRELGIFRTPAQAIPAPHSQRVTHRWYRTLTCALAVCALPACSVPFTGDDCTLQPLPVGTQKSAFRSYWLGANHSDLTENGLNDFVSQEVAQALGVEAEAMDDPVSHPGLKNTSLFHFDNCQLGETIAKLRARYERIVDALDPHASDLTKARQQFGRALHTVQDFYSHSNWVESGREHLAFDGGLPFPDLAPSDRIDGMLVINHEQEYEATRDAGHRTPWVFVDGTWLEVLMTGTFVDNEDLNRCHSSLAIPHGDAFDDDCSSAEAINAYLSKDDPDSPYHAAAIDLAQQQTTQEFCRLSRLVRQRHGDAGLEFLLSEWVTNREAFYLACSTDFATDDAK